VTWVDANEIKQTLSNNDLISFLNDLGAEPQRKGNNIHCKTICHNGHKHKLIYFGDSKLFRCFTGNCGSMDIYGLVGRVMDLDFYDSFKYVCMKFGISYKSEFFESDRIDNSFFQKFKKKKEKIDLKKLDKKILDSYWDLYHKSWIDDGISINSMKKFSIKFSIMDNQIIIPHFDIDGNLIGVRARNLNPELVEDGKKYMPACWKKKVLKHPTGESLYGLNITKENVEKYKTIILFESEKSVLQLDTMIPNMSIGACLSGSNMTFHQLDILKTLNIDEVIIALDKEYEEVGSQEEKFYAQKITRVFIDKLAPYYRTSVIWDTEGLLDLKDSPTDKGLEVFSKLFEQRIVV